MFGTKKLPFEYPFFLSSTVAELVEWGHSSAAVGIYLHPGG